MGARGASASSEAADVVILADRLDRVGEAIVIAQRARHIALESIVAGMSLSLLAMLAASVGWLAPVAAALVQEVIDVAVILNALRALRSGSTTFDTRSRRRLDANCTTITSVWDAASTACALSQTRSMMPNLIVQRRL